MKEVQGDIWNYHKKGHWIVITTNGTVRKDGACVMGRGVAKQAAARWPGLPYSLGKRLLQGGNKVYILWGFGIITFPVKHHWREIADTALIARSCAQLVSAAEVVLDLDSYCWEDQQVKEGKLDAIYMVRPGCGNGQLDWADVKPILEKYLDDRFIIVEIGP